MNFAERNMNSRSHAFHASRNGEAQESGSISATIRSLIALAKRRGHSQVQPVKATVLTKASHKANRAWRNAWRVASEREKRYPTVQVDGSRAASRKARRAAWRQDRALVKLQYRGVNT